MLLTLWKANFQEVFCVSITVESKSLLDLFQDSQCPS